MIDSEKLIAYCEEIMDSPDVDSLSRSERLKASGAALAFEELKHKLETGHFNEGTVLKSMDFTKVPGDWRPTNA